MVQFLSIIFFLGFLQFLLGFSKVPVFLCHSYIKKKFIGLSLNPRVEKESFFFFLAWKFPCY